MTQMTRKRIDLFSILFTIIYTLVITGCDYISPLKNSHNVKNPHEIPSTKRLLPEKYDWCYLGISFHEFSKRSEYIIFSPYSGIIDDSNKQYSIVFVFNNDHLDSDGEKGPSANDRLTLIEMVGEFELPPHVSELDYSVLEPTQNNPVYKTPYLLHVNKDFIVTIRILVDYKGTLYRRLRIHYPIDNPHDIEYGPHKANREDEKNVKEEIINFSSNLAAAVDGAKTARHH